ncbi:hypothetical protein PVAND_010810 [Polypedilum vanderplanki]|uniref:J domain-containing protein n=1 Tax=Polypedilum vanderplanki TaxID=319348 RepID=A0A9J6CHM9_POLVA|nr:hypothetical protein PVAND_010810 [Polypedilum vanderplanki]
MQFLKNIFFIFVVFWFAFVYCSNQESDHLYKILNISKNATKVQIKEAYKKLAKQYHPDKNQKDENTSEKFSEIRMAYEILNNDKKRKLYDKCGEECAKNNENENDLKMDVFQVFQNLNFFDFENEKSEMKGSDILIYVAVTLEEIYNGKYLEITRNKAVLKPTSGTRKCNCRREMVGKIIGHNFMHTFQEKCDECRNVKLVQEEKVLELEIESGQEDNYEMIFKEEGEPKIDGVAGDLILKFKQMQHATFQRKNHDLYMNITIDLKDALIGFSFEFSHLDGHKVPINKNSITYVGEIMKIENEGMPIVGNDLLFGDLFVKFYVEFPKTDFNDSQKEIIKTLFK